MRNYWFSLLLIIFTACNQDLQTEKKEVSQTDTIKVGSKHTLVDYDSLVKFEPGVDFDDFKVKELYKGAKADANINSTKLSKRFRTAIRTDYEERGLNFAGHYCFSYWGCGSGCKLSAIVDLKTGRVYDGPEGGLTYTFQTNSRMVIINHPEASIYNNDKSGYYLNYGIYPPEIWIWNEQKKSFYRYDYNKTAKN